MVDTSGAPVVACALQVIIASYVASAGNTDMDGQTRAEFARRASVAVPPAAR